MARTDIWHGKVWAFIVTDAPVFATKMPVVPGRTPIATQNLDPDRSILLVLLEAIGETLQRVDDWRQLRGDPRVLPRLAEAALPRTQARSLHATTQRLKVTPRGGNDAYQVKNIDCFAL